MSKRNKYTIKKYTIKKHKSKGGTKTKSKTTEQAKRTPQQKTEDFMRVLHKTHNKHEKYRRERERENGWLTDEDMKIRDRDILTAMNTANNATLKGGKKYKRKNNNKKTRKVRKKYKK
jgi:hypothetical protein